MKYLRFLHRLYPLYVAVRFKTRPSAFWSWTVAIYTYLAMGVMLLRIDLPSKMFQRNSDCPVIRQIQAIFYLQSCIMTSKFNLLDIGIGFGFNLIASLIWIIAAHKARMGKHIMYWQLWFIRFYESWFCPIISFSVFFKLSHCTEYVGAELDLQKWAGFAMQLGSVILIFWHTLMASVFLDPVDFMKTSRLDLYDGKTQVWKFLVMFLNCFACHMFQMYVATSWLYHIAILTLCFACIMFYLRALTIVHVSIIGEFFDLAPLFSVPIVMFVQSDSAGSWRSNAIAMFCVHVALAIVLVVKNIVMTNDILKVEASLNETEHGELSVSLGISTISVLRILSSSSGNPQLFAKLLSMRRSASHGSRMIEVTRFLAVFPSQRKEILKVLPYVRSSSNYNRFLVYFFLKSLRSMTNDSEERHKQELYEVQKKYILHHNRYWKARKQHRIVASVCEGLATCYFFIETKFELEGLVRRFPYDKRLRVRYGDFLVNACGEYEIGMKTIYSADCISVDPYLHEAVFWNHNILKYCTHEEVILSTLNDARETVASSSQEEIKPTIHRVPVRPSRRRIVAFIVINAITTVAMALAIFIRYAHYQSRIVAQASDVFEMGLETVDRYQYACASLFYPFAVHNMDYSSLSEEEQCKLEFNTMTMHVYDYFNYIPEVKRIAENFIRFTVVLLQHADYETSACDLLRYAVNETAKAPEYITKSALEAVIRTINGVVVLDEMISTENNYRFYFTVCILISLVLTVLPLIALCFELNLVMRNEQIAIDWLSSDSHAQLLLFERENDLWNGLQNATKETDASYSFEEENDTQSLEENFIIANTKGDLCGSCVSIVWPMIACVILFPLFTFLLQIAIDQRTEQSNYYISQVSGVNDQVEAIMEMLIAIEDIILRGAPRHVLEGISERILKYDNNISKDYWKMRCWNLMGMTCSSPYDLLSAVIKGTADTQVMTFVTLPALVDVTLIALDESIFSDLGKIFQENITYEVGFFVDFAVISISLILCAVSCYRIMNQGLNSLYHFPWQLLAQPKEETEPDRFEVNEGTQLPDHVIVVASNIETDEIYSISENVLSILGRSTVSLIGSRFNEVFPATPGNPDVREYTMPDRTTKRVLRCSSAKRRQVVTTLMISSIPMTIGNNPYQHESLSEKLMYSMPVHFAKIFGETETRSLELSNSIVTMVRFDTGVPTHVLEQFFAGITSAVMNYSAIKIVRATGGMFICSSVKPMSPLVGFAFVRDIIHPGSGWFRGQGADALYSIHIEFVEHYELVFNTETEPCIDIDLPHLSAWERILYSSGNKTVTFAAHLRKSINRKGRDGRMKRIKISGRMYDIIEYTFDGFCRFVTELFG